MMFRTQRISSRSVLAPTVLLAAVALFACGDQTAYAEHHEGDAGQIPDILAQVGGVDLTLAEIEETVSAQLADLDRKRFGLIEQGLAVAVQNKLIELEAAKQGKTEEQYLADAVEDPSDEEIQAFYDQNQARIRRPLDQVRGELVGYLRQQKVAALAQNLRGEYKVVSHLEPPRAEIDNNGHPSKGPDDAPLVLVEFSDFECPFCSRINPTIDKVRENYGDKVKVVFRQFPLLSIHQNAQKAGEASLCAHDQEKFWEMHDLLFAEQRKLTVTDLKEKAVRLELDTEAFDSCLDSDKYAAQVTSDMQLGGQLGVTGTPALFLNGRFLQGGALPYEKVAEFIEDELSRLETE